MENLVENVLEKSEIIGEKIGINIHKFIKILFKTLFGIIISIFLGSIFFISSLIYGLFLRKRK